jgi:hypothetical protein
MTDDRLDGYDEQSSEGLPALERCDDRFYDNDEPIADRLFAWIERHRSSVRIGRAS